MRVKNAILPIVLVLSLAVFLPDIHAEPSVTIIMEKTTYSYCEKLFYIIEVSEITGEPAIIHIRDEAGKGSSAIPIPITNLQNPVPALVAFDKERFSLGRYFIDVEYANVGATVEFNLIDSNKVCLPEIIKQIIPDWLTGSTPDGVLLDALQKFVDKEIIDIPFEINGNNIFEIDMPDWVKNIGYWWISEAISDEDFAQVISYLIDENIISLPKG
ncbi:MAG: hypothetical protein IIA83_09885 [Thaumarchaeota archaeon]|nr:hypothetical protein [Nitrososphaerota archaeon]